MVGRLVKTMPNDISDETKRASVGRRTTFHGHTYLALSLSFMFLVFTASPVRTNSLLMMPIGFGALYLLDRQAALTTGFEKRMTRFVLVLQVGLFFIRDLA